MNAQWDAEVEITEALVRQILDEQFPEFRGARLSLLGEGWDNAAWLVDDEWVFRFPRRQMGADLIESEVTVLTAIADRLPLRVSAPEKVGRPSAAYQWSFAGYRCIQGQELCQAAVPADQRLQIAEQLGSFLRELHSISSDEAAGLGAQQDTIRRMDIEYRTGKALANLQQAVDLDLIESASPWESLLMELKNPCPEPDPICLVHGDLYSRHVLVETQEDGPAEISGIIDWGDLHINDPANDLAVAWVLFDRAGRERMFEIYGQVSPDRLALSRHRAICHTTICLVYGREGGVPELEAESRRALDWLLDA